MIPNFAGEPATFAALGRTWTLSRFSLSKWRPFVEWVKSQMPDPRELAFAYISNEHIPESKKAEIVQAALDREWRFTSIESEEVREARQTPEGMTQIVYLLLRDHHPEITPDDASIIVAAAVFKELAAAIARSEGEVPAAPGNEQAPAE
jgi:hypothetical protein